MAIIDEAKKYPVDEMGFHIIPTDLFFQVYDEESKLVEDYKNDRFVRWSLMKRGIEKGGVYFRVKEWVPNFGPDGVPHL